MRVEIVDLKAILFVMTFTGYSKHIERKACGLGKLIEKNTPVMFDDEETLVGKVSQGGSRSMTSPAATRSHKKVSPYVERSRLLLIPQ